jgi:hypothetical protein
MYTQRKKDRRSFTGKTSFPLKTKGGCLVEEDRRIMPDRRLGNIHLEVIDSVDFGLSERLTFASPYLTGTEDY